MTTTTRVVGQSLTRIDAPGKVTGSAIYAADFALPGMLFGKVFRSAERRDQSTQTCRARV